MIGTVVSNSRRHGNEVNVDFVALRRVDVSSSFLAPTHVEVARCCLMEFSNHCISTRPPTNIHSKLTTESDDTFMLIYVDLTQAFSESDYPVPAWRCTSAGSTASE
jgi:hypothetical protein